MGNTGKRGMMAAVMGLALSMENERMLRRETMHIDVGGLQPLKEGAPGSRDPCRVAAKKQRKAKRAARKSKRGY